MSDFDFHDPAGMPEPLPQGERILWRGRPDWRAFARHSLHLRAFAAYFGALIAWRIGSSLWNGADALSALKSGAWTLPLAAFALGLIALFAWLVARTTVYTLTDRRLVMKIGVALPISFNVPFRVIESADLRLFRDGSGDIALRLVAPNRIAWMHLWPHARSLRAPQPALRAIPEAREVAALLAQSMRAVAGSEQTTQSAPVRDARPAGAPLVTALQ